MVTCSINNSFRVKFNSVYQLNLILILIQFDIDSSVFASCYGSYKKVVNHELVTIIIVGFVVDALNRQSLLLSNLL